MARLAVRRRGVVLAVTALVLVVLVVLAWLVAAGSTGGRSGTAGVASREQAPVPDEVATPDSAFTPGGSGRPAEASARSAYPAITSAPAPGAPASPPPWRAPGPPPVDLSGIAPDRSVVRTALLAMTVADLPSAASVARDAAASAGGFVAGERSVDRSSTLTLRVPAPRLGDVVSRITGTGRVTERSEQAQDVTDQVVDLEGRLATQRTSLARVRALLDRAGTVGEVVSVESELTQREAELESLQRRLAAVSGQVALSTLNLWLTPEPAANPDRAGGGGFLTGLDAGWRALLTAGGTALTVLGAVLPFVVLVGLIVAAALAGRRALRRHSA